MLCLSGSLQRSWGWSSHYVWAFTDSPKSGSFRERDGLPWECRDRRPRTPLTLRSTVAAPAVPTAQLSRGKRVLCLGVALRLGRHRVKAACGLPEVSAKVSEYGLQHWK